MASEQQRLEHQGAAPATGLQAGMGPADTSFTLLSGTGYPTGAGGKLFWLVIDPGTPQEEKILCSARSGTTVTVNSGPLGGRGGDGTSPTSHAPGTTNVQHIFPAIEADDANRHVYVTTDDDHTQYLHYLGATTGAPAGASRTGDVAYDATNHTLWLDVAGGSPGTFVPIPTTQEPWQTYSPVWNALGINPVIGNGTLTGRYVQHGKTCTVVISLVAGSTTTFGTLQTTMSLPVAPRTGIPQFPLNGYRYDGTAWWPALGQQTAGAVVNTLASNATNAGKMVAYNASVGTTSDVFVISGTYETA